jgi:hypothetical protein
MSTAITCMPYQQLIQSNLCGIKQGRKGTCSNCHCHMQFHGQFHGTLCKCKYNFQIGRLDFKVHWPFKTLQKAPPTSKATVLKLATSDRGCTMCKCKYIFQIYKLDFKAHWPFKTPQKATPTSKATVLVLSH